MTDFRYGDRAIFIQGEPYRLRLSVSAIAELASVFDAQSPKDLAERLRRANVADWNRIFQLIATPIPPNLTRDEMVKILPEISTVIREALRA